LVDKFRSGGASICPEGRLLLIENLSKRVDLYDLPGSMPSYTFPVPSKQHITKDVGFAEGTLVVIVGECAQTLYIPFILLYIL